MHNQQKKIHYWQLQEAKAKLSELVKFATSKGPQGISIRGVPEVIVISTKEYERLIKPKSNLWQFFRDSPLAGINLNLERDKSADRDVEL